MKILGIVGSCRKLGNTEILVKEALMAAQEQGAEVDIVRWTNYDIFPCEGDAVCMFLDKDCKHKDRDGHDYLLNMMYEFDGVVLGAPCYILEVEAVVKQFIDRLFILSSNNRVRLYDLFSSYQNYRRIPPAASPSATIHVPALRCFSTLRGSGWESEADSCNSGRSVHP